MNEPVNKPTPEEAAAALRTARESRERVAASALGARRTSVVAGLVVFGYTVAIDLAPATRPWLTWVVLAVALILVVVLRTRVGGSWLGQQVAVSDRALPPAVWRVAPFLGLSIIAAVAVALLRIPHGTIVYGALAGLYVIFLGPRFQLWLLRRQDKD
ncbi:hypothetical protein [Amycolatopsis echigonensis]|uniref:Uncharacterized protein n=1 Tax=Amycolatopsis echigonensis TaxID=2576905 RepID=A0A2N3WR88_9PSEU|nr:MULTISPECIES: hypothetical protein [Amycolatopsis]MBB2505393.1 hypothetical protein [Amycolatopsis echigonensis]PKV96397.1 hypothetical protein ATK30_7343 [Amycolatopsis niigatensis]